MKKKILITVLALFGVMAIFAQEYIAVFPFEVLDNAVTQNESFQLYQVFSNEFTNRKPSGINIVPRQDVDRLINTEARFQLSVFSAQAKTAEMMQVKNATQILSGVIGKVGNRINITVSLYTYPSLDPLLGGTSLHVANSVELLDKIPELVRNMLNEIAGEGRNNTAQNLRQAEIHYYRGRVFFDNKDRANAILELDEAIRLNPNYKEAYYGRAVVYWYWDDKQKAIADLTQVLRMDPNDFNARYNRAGIYFSAGEFDYAIADYTHLIRINSTSAESYMWRGLSYHRKSNFSLAIADYLKVKELNYSWADKDLEDARNRRTPSPGGTPPWK